MKKYPEKEAGYTLTIFRMKRLNCLPRPPGDTDNFHIKKVLVMVMICRNLLLTIYNQTQS